MAFSLDTQLVVSKTDLMLRSLVRSLPLAGSEPKRQLPGPSDTERWRNCRKIYNVLAVKKPFLYIGPDESHVTDIIRRYDAYFSPHGDVEGVVTNILRATRNIVLGSPRGVEVETLFSKNRLIPQMICAVEQVGDQTRDNLVRRATERGSANHAL